MMLNNSLFIEQETLLLMLMLMMLRNDGALTNVNVLINR